MPIRKQTWYKSLRSKNEVKGHRRFACFNVDPPCCHLPLGGPFQPRRRRQDQRRRGATALRRLPTLFISAGVIFIHLFDLLIPERSPNLHSEKLSQLPPLENVMETVRRLRIAVVTEGRKGLTSLAWGHIQICQQSEAPLLSRSPRGRTHRGHGGHGSFPKGRLAEAPRSQREAPPPSWSTSLTRCSSTGGNPKEDPV